MREVDGIVERWFSITHARPSHRQLINDEMFTLSIMVADNYNTLPLATWFFLFSRARVLDRNCANCQKVSREKSLMQSRLYRRYDIIKYGFDRRHFRKPWSLSNHRFAKTTPNHWYTKRYCKILYIVSRVVYFSMFLLETRFYGIYEELPHNVTKDAISALRSVIPYRCATKGSIATKRTISPWTIKNYETKVIE